MHAQSGNPTFGHMRKQRKHVVISGYKRVINMIKYMLANNMQI